MKEPFQLKWYDVALTAAGVLLTYVSLRAQMASGVFSEKATPVPIYLRLEVGLAAMLFYCIVSIFTAMPFAGIPSPSAPSRSPWRYGRL